jgi:hypothetical protein
MNVGRARVTLSVWTLCLLAATRAPAQDAAAPDASASWAAMRHCAVIADDDERHACTDEVLRNAGLLPTPQARSQANQKHFGLELPRIPHSARAPKPVRQAKASSTPVAEPPAAAEPDDSRISVTLQEVTVRGDGSLVLITNQGAVWTQVESDPIRPRPVEGQSMMIEQTAMGGFMCHTGKWTAFRCRRLH